MSPTGYAIEKTSCSTLDGGRTEYDVQDDGRASERDHGEIQPQSQPLAASALPDGEAQQAAQHEHVKEQEENVGDRRIRLLFLRLINGLRDLRGAPR